MNAQNKIKKPTVPIFTYMKTYGRIMNNKLKAIILKITCSFIYM